VAQRATFPHQQLPSTMTEPNNPLFEDEKEFLERKKLEYERALRGDVEEIKEQTIHVGKVALVGAGIAGGVWLLVKAFSGGKPKKKHKKHKHKAAFEDYAGFDGFEDYDGDDHDQELDSLAMDYNSLSMPTTTPTATRWAMASTKTATKRIISEAKAKLMKPMKLTITA